MPWYVWDINFCSYCCGRRPELILSTHTMAHDCSRGSDALFRPPKISARTWCTRTQPGIWTERGAHSLGFSVTFLVFLYEWERMTSVCIRVTIKLSGSIHLHTNLLSLYSWVEPYCAQEWFRYPLISWWTSRLFPYLSRCDEGGSEHEWVLVCSRTWSPLGLRHPSNWLV